MEKRQEWEGEYLVTASPSLFWSPLVRGCALGPFLTGPMFVRRTYFGQFDELTIRFLIEL